MQITPGYDFGVNEVPTYAKFQLMINGMSITGIAEAQVSALLVTERFLDVTTSLSLAAEGFLNRDQRGRLWVKSRNGMVQLYRAGWGGWESIRYPAFAAVDTYNYPINQMGPIGQLRSHTTDQTTESSVGYRPGTSIGKFIAKNADTMVSGGFGRLVCYGGWGAEVLASKRIGNDRSDRSAAYIVRSATATQDQEVTGFPAHTVNATGQARKQGLALRQNPSSVRTLAWWFGMEAMQD